MKPSYRYHEIQLPSLMVNTILLALAMVTAYFAMEANAFLGFLTIVLIVVVFIPMHVTVATTTLVVGYGLVHVFKWHIPIHTIAQAKAMVYTPWSDTWGWGIRYFFNGNRAFTMQGDEGVTLTLTNGRKILIGSQTPQKLVLAINKTITELKATSPELFEEPAQDVPASEAGDASTDSSKSNDTTLA